jgi:multidrug resistance efflux pump
MNFIGSSPKQSPEPGVEGEQHAPDTADERHGAVHDLQRQLEERLKQPTLEPGVADFGSEDAALQKGTPPAKSKTPTRLIKALLGVAIVVVFGWGPLRTFLQPSSVEAIVNSRVVTVRAPIAGDVVATSAGGLAVNGLLSENQPLLRIVNTRADRSRLDALQDGLAELQIRRKAQEAKIAAVQQAYDELAQSVAHYRLGRVAQLEARANAAEASIAAAEARRDDAVAAAERAGSLMQSGAVSTVEADRRRHDRTVAEQEAVAAQRQLDAATAELEAARQGSFIGDGYSDRPSSEQRRDELALRLDELNAEVGAMDEEIARLQEEIASETSRYEERSDVALSLPVTGRIWEVMVAPGEYVRVGQDLLKVLDCSGAVVTANVTEAVYNDLSVGTQAPANLAIRPSDLSREAYRVTVRVPALAARQDCAIGRTGRVIFANASANPG